MTQEQANWEWMDARVKKLESYIEAYKENRVKQADYIKHLEKGLESSLNLNKAQATRGMKELTDEDVEHLVKRWFNCHPEAKLDEQLTTPLYSVVNLCKGLLKK
jgi:hypothetical protein